MWQVAPKFADVLLSLRLKFYIWWMKLQTILPRVADFFGVAMQNLCPVLLGFLFCPPVLLVKPFAQLRLTEGETATFTCSISNPDYGNYLNWYQWGPDCQPVKLDPGSRKYSVSKRDRRTYQMEIRDVEKNDSGMYYCWVNAIQLKVPFLKSNEGNLTVTEKVAAAQPPNETSQVKEKDKGGDRKDAKTSFTDLRGTGLFVLLVVLYFSVWLIRRRRQKQKKQKDGHIPLEEEPPALTVFTVNYEMLEFPGGKKTKPTPSPKSIQREQTEYATIVFLSKTPEAAEMGDSKQTPGPVCAQQP
ncbi:programmed cell death protein 1-like isoform X2 [Crotalus tigris]|uniref:programmed cell death protein 1-like isoform X2 n=1 Tax=Crotalus tigris TaxID=88082 RepID=UPI00192FB2D6|nr:programmed cell death protein 1-like isoform X2 [Crotalus tigris]